MDLPIHLRRQAKGRRPSRHLRCQKPYRKRYGGGYDRRGRLHEKSIDERPTVVNRKSRIGDRAADTVLGKERKRGPAIISLVERKSAFTIIGRIGRRRALETRSKMGLLLAPYRDFVHTITCDNGKEFAQHQAIADDLEADVYFAHPYASWERGLNENTNGLIRQYFPKKRDFATIGDHELKEAQERLNHRPRKKLGFKTPYEVFFKTNTLLTVALPS